MISKYKIYDDYQWRVDAFVKDLSDNDLISHYAEDRSPECLEFDSWDDSFQCYYNMNDYQILRELSELGMNDEGWDEDDHNDEFNNLLSQNYVYQAIREEIINRWKQSISLNDNSVITQKEKIAKALILKFNNEGGRWNYFFRAYDLMSKEPGFRSNLFEENNFQHICWELDNTQKEVRPFAIDIEYTRLPEGHSEIINQFLQ